MVMIIYFVWPRNLKFKISICCFMLKPNRILMWKIFVTMQQELTDLLNSPVVFAHNDLLSGNLMLNDDEGTHWPLISYTIYFLLLVILEELECVSIHVVFSFDKYAICMSFMSKSVKPTLLTKEIQVGHYCMLARSLHGRAV